MYIRLIILLLIAFLVYVGVIYILKFFKKEDEISFEETRENLAFLIEERYKSSVFKERLLKTINDIVDLKNRFEEEKRDLKQLEKQYKKDMSSEIKELEYKIDKINEQMFNIHKSLIKEKTTIKEQSIKDIEENLKIFKLTEVK